MCFVGYFSGIRNIYSYSVYSSTSITTVLSAIIKFFPLVYKLGQNIGNTYIVTYMNMYIAVWLPILIYFMILNETNNLWGNPKKEALT